MTTTADTNQIPDEGDLFTIVRRMFGETPEPEEYDYVRVPGLHLTSELEDVIEPGTDYVVWQGGQLHNGRMLLTVYCRRPKMGKEAPPVAPEAPAAASTPTPAATSAKANLRKRSR